MVVKTPIRFFNKTAVRARWDEATSIWWYASVDLVSAFVHTKNPRIYWNTLKKRNPQLSTFCIQLKFMSHDGKKYMTDCLSETGVKQLLLTLPLKNQHLYLDWLNGYLDPIDDQSKRRAYELYETSLVDEIEVGTIKGLQQIHAFLFDGLYDFAGKIRDKNISKGGFIFANCAFFDQIFQTIESMPDQNVDEIIAKYIEMNIAHPFMEGNGRATRIWLDMLLKERIKKCVDWQRIEKEDYLSAMEKSPVNPVEITKLIKGALTDKINDRDIYLKGIDYSYYYEEID